MKQVFEKYLGKEDLLEVYTRDSENFDVGRVLGLDDDFVLLHAMSKCSCTVRKQATENKR